MRIQFRAGVGIVTRSPYLLTVWPGAESEQWMTDAAIGAGAQ